MTHANEAVERLKNENRQLTDSLAAQNQQAIDEIAVRDGQVIVLRQLITTHEATIERISGLFFNFSIKNSIFNNISF